ncbi:MAG: phosphoribosylglycinamide formyltransferase [Gammaproteobacteria bacterium]|nr:phosphoribosylglycinamide formyltransferase [Gammaproteobacteria bacterium]
MPKETLSIVVLISGSGSNLQALIDALAAQSINAEIKAVLSNKADAFGLERARKAGIPGLFIDHTAFSDRLGFDQAMINTIDPYHPDIIVLAGFMRILSNEFVDHYAGRLINIHPSLLPDFKGLNTHQRALDAGHKKHGASVHFVSNELDGGPVIAQIEVPVEEHDTAETLRLKVIKQEHIIYPRVIQWFAEHRLRLQGQHIYFDHKLLEKPLLLNSLPASQTV